MNAELIVIKLNTITGSKNEYLGPEKVETQTDFKAIIQEKFDTVLKGISGNVLVKFGEKLFLCERNNLNPNGPYVRHSILWHPLSWMFNRHYLMKFTSQSKVPAVVSPESKQ